MMNFKTIKELFISKTKAFSKYKYLCTIGGDFYTYEQFGCKTEEISELLLSNNIQPGDKVGILSQNMPNWGVAFFSCAAYNRIAVPLLPDFSETEIENILEHSEAKAIFVSKKLSRKLSGAIKEKLQTIIEIDDFTVLKGESACNKPASELKEALQAPEFTPKEEELATIIYTSGTTGNSKGVMLSHKNLCSHLKSAMQLRPSFEWDVWLSILPLSHTLENSLSLLLPFSSGASVYYLDKAPTPSALLQAFKVVKPTTILVVPLIIEKIYKNSILPKINAKKITATMYKTVLGRKLVHRIVGKQMREMFGGNVRFFVIGGAKLDGTVERFLYEAKFPYAIGYGLTECCPLLAGAIPSMVKWQTTGPAVPGVQLRIDNVNPETGEGEIVAKGDNIMMGYYKNPTATAEAFTEDGWFRTQDLGYIDEKGWLSIRGRLKNMILGPSGENIYPEEIETVINSHASVVESLVTTHKGNLIARIHPNPDKLETYNKKREELYIAYLEKKSELIQEYEAKKAELIEAYSSKKAEISAIYELKKKELALKKSEFAKAYDQKRRELYKAYAEKREDAFASYHSKKEELKESLSSSFDSLKKEVSEYVNARVNKFSRITEIYIQHEAFQKTATSKIKRYLYN
ncbi:MAG: AMP-binding protein [Bacteroidales bacterium]|nr:AMP-binding protein [Bacteroidales bacterium]